MPSIKGATVRNIYPWVVTAYPPRTLGLWLPTLLVPPLLLYLQSQILVNGPKWKSQLSVSAVNVCVIKFQRP
jgi:hypothetical protein